MDQIIEVYDYLLKMPRWQKWLIILVLGVVLYTFLLFYKVQPLKKQYLEKKKRLESLSLTVNRLKILEKRKKLLLREISQLRKDIENIEKKLPTGKENVSQIIRSINKSDSKMTIESIVRRSKVSTKYYVKYPYEVILKGTYPSFVSWCEKLSKSERIINFGSISIRSVMDKSSNSTIEVKLRVEAFTLKE
jgi:type IV pilus assembly protein PilO